MLYHGVRTTPSSSIYRLGLALFDLEQPEKCLIRGDSWMFAPLKLNMNAMETFRMLCSLVAIQVCARWGHHQLLLWRR